MAKVSSILKRCFDRFRLSSIPMYNCLQACGLHHLETRSTHQLLLSERHSERQVCSCSHECD